MIYAALGALAVSAFLWIMGTRFYPEWEKREMDNLAGKWHLLFALGSIFAIGAAVGASALGAPVLGAIGLSVIAWLVPLVSATDFTTLLIPREISVVAYYLPLPLLAVYSWQQQSWSPLINFGIWGIAIVVFFIPVLLGRMGMGDLRLFILFGTALAWWAGPYHIVLGLLVAAILQLILFVIAFSTGKIGVRRTVTPLSSETDDLSAPLEEGQDASDKTTEIAKEQPKSKQRLFVPFGPALLYGAVLAGLFAAYLPYDELIDLLII